MTLEIPWQLTKFHAEVRICELISLTRHGMVLRERSPDVSRFRFLRGKATLGVWI